MVRNWNLRVRYFIWISAMLCAAVAHAEDVDGDGVEDSIDVCGNTPPDIAVDAAGRPLGDLDGDCDADLVDFELMQSGFTGPLPGGCWTDLDCEDDDACTINLCSGPNGDCELVDIPNCGPTCTVTPQCGTEIRCGDYLTGEINPFTQTDKFCFCVSENENLRIFVTEVGATNFAPAWRVLDAGGNSVGPCGGTLVTTAGRDCGPLPAAGNPYVIEIEDQGRNENGFYSVHLHQYDPSQGCGDDDIPPCEQDTGGTIENINDGDLFNITATQGQMLRITVVKDALAPANFASNWRLLDGQGVPAAPCDAFAATVSRDCGPLSAALNPYRIEVEDQGRNEIGTFDIHVQPLTPAVDCGVSDILCDTPVTGTIDQTILDTDLLNFTAGNGEIVRISVAKRLPSGANFAANWRVLGSDGVAFGTCGGFATTLSRECGPLPSLKSPYRIEIDDQGRNDTGTYEVYFQRLTQFRECDVVDLQCGTPTIGSIATLLDTDLFRFDSPEDATVRIDVIEQPGGGAAFAPNWRLLNAAGIPTSNCSAFAITTSRDCGPLAASGNPYRIEIEDQTRDDVGSYQVAVEFLSGCPD